MTEQSATDSFGQDGMDAPVNALQQDRYGFTAVAEGLADAILALNDSGSTVIGIEGAWGAGKTSLVNLMTGILAQRKSPNTHIIPVSPWLDGDVASPVASLLLPVVRILEEEEQKQLTEEERGKREDKASWRSNIEGYIRATAKHAQPWAELASVLPYLTRAGNAVKALEEIGTPKAKTATELRAEIEQKIQTLDMNFIVVLDDLDRLEPAQAVEVLRLVRSVADFPRFRYVMCYDSKVLAHAVERGLGVTNGRLYLQKIVQVSFSLPRPESFDLRREYKTGAAAIYQDVKGTVPGATTLAALEEAIDVYGKALTTPREVNQALNALRFRYPAMRDYVYFPDLCLLQLLRVVKPDLYDWIERYLTERAVVESKDGSVSSVEVNAMSNELITLLGHFRNAEAQEPRTLGRWVPGIGGFSKLSVKLFEPIDSAFRDENTALRRLGSAGYWRYYFSFSAPQNVLPESAIEAVLQLAGTDVLALEQHLLAKISSNGISSRTWFEHIITRLTPHVTAGASFVQLHGLVTCLFNCADRITQQFRARDPFFSFNDLGLYELALRLCDEMLRINRQVALQALQQLFTLGQSMNWALNLMVRLVQTQRLKTEVLSPAELGALRAIMTQRLHDPAAQTRLLARDNMCSYLTAWQKIDSPEVVETWLNSVTQSDEQFLTVLLKLREQMTGGAGREYGPLRFPHVRDYFSDEKSLRERWEQIEKKGEFPEKIAAIQHAIALVGV